MRDLPITAILTALALLYGLRWRLQVEAVQYRLKRLDRLLEGGRRREAVRVLAIVKRDSAVWFRPKCG